MTSVKVTLLPQKEIAVKTFLTGEIAKHGKPDLSLDKLYDGMAEVLKRRSPSEQDHREMDEYVRIAAYLHVNAAERTDVIGALTQRGVEEQLALGIAATVTLAAFSPIIEPLSKDIKAITGFKVPPGDEVPVIAALDHLAGELGQILNGTTRDKLLEMLAQEVKDHPPGERDRKIMDDSVNAASYLRVNVQDQAEITGTLERLGVSEEYSRMILAGAVIAAFLPIIGEHVKMSFISG